MGVSEQAVIRQSFFIKNYLENVISLFFSAITYVPQMTTALVEPDNFVYLQLPFPHERVFFKKKYVGEKIPFVLFFLRPQLCDEKVNYWLGHA